jgi:lipid-A-disaccharide synthase
MKYYIIAGEASGDLHGSNLMKGIYAEDPQAEIRFWGGDCMVGVWAGSTVSETNPHLQHDGLVRHYKEGAVMGFVEVLAKAGKLLKNVKFCKEDILAWNPDVVILIDYPGFNFKIAEFAHKAGFKVFYYIAPKVWASREGRIRKLKAYVDKLFIVFPFEKPYFDAKGV